MFFGLSRGLFGNFFFGHHGVFLAKAANSTAYKFEAAYAAHFPPVSGWMILKDYNCDGIEDLLVAGSGSPAGGRMVFHRAFVLTRLAEGAPLVVTRQIFFGN